MQVETPWASREGAGEGYPYPLPRGIRLRGCEIPIGVQGRAPAEKVWCILFVIEPIR